MSHLELENKILKEALNKIADIRAEDDVEPYPDEFGALQYVQLDYEEANDSLQKAVTIAREAIVECLTTSAPIVLQDLPLLTPLNAHIVTLSEETLREAAEGRKA
jgi:hypothetical protein